MQSPAIHLLATRFKDRAGSVNAGLRAGGKGKSGGYRVITAYFGMDVPVYLIAMLSKGERSNFSRVRLPVSR